MGPTYYLCYGAFKSLLSDTVNRLTTLHVSSLITYYNKEALCSECSGILNQGVILLLDNLIEHKVYKGIRGFAN